MPMDENATAAVAEFMAKRGTVVRAPATIPVTGPEVLDYLQSHGVAVGFARNSLMAPYMCHGKRVSLRKLVDVANEHRSAERLPPFAARGRTA